MITLSEFEGIAGFRWGALLGPNGEVNLSENAPPNSEKKVAFVKRLLAMAELPMNGADLLFEKGKVLIRSGLYGLLLLFCDSSTNASMIGIVLDDQERGSNEVSNPTTQADETVTTSRILHSITGEHEALSENLVTELLQLYIEFLGPLAPALARKETEKAGIDLQQLDAARWNQLLQILAHRISSDEKRELFLDRAVMLKAVH